MDSTDASPPHSAAASVEHWNGLVEVGRTAASSV